MRTFTIEEDTLPDLKAMMLVTLRALRTMGGSATIQELDERIAEIEGVSEDEQALTMKNDPRPRMKYYLAWARTYLRRGEAVENSKRGVWSLTDVGEGIDNKEDVQKIYDRVLTEERLRQREKRVAKDQTDREKSEDNGDPDYADDTADWRLTLLDALGAMDPSAFERLSQRVLREAGFTKVEVRGQSGDGGIDGVGILRVNLVSFQVFFQCKRWKGSVGSREIRDFRGAMQGRADKGLFITTGTFTGAASEEATRDGAIAVDLIDGENLCELLKTFELGVSTETIEQMTVDTEWIRNF